MPAEQEQRHVYYDRDLKIEAYNLSGIVQKFPNHFHEYYVIGFVEEGKRRLWRKGLEYDVSAGDLILFNPRENHFCAPTDGSILDYRAVNINTEILSQAVKKITGRDFIPYFTQNVVYQSDITQFLSELYGAVLAQAPGPQKEEAFFSLLRRILQKYAIPVDQSNASEPNRQIQNLCAYIEQHYAKNITLDEMLSMTSFGKSYLIRAFTKQAGVSPYRYLQTIRIGRAKKLLEQGIAPIDVASKTGFADQSHFTNFFKTFIGLTPKQYSNIFTDAPPSDTPENKDAKDW